MVNMRCRVEEREHVLSEKGLFGDRFRLVAVVRPLLERLENTSQLSYPISISSSLIIDLYMAYSKSSIRQKGDGKQPFNC